MNTVPCMKYHVSFTFAVPQSEMCLSLTFSLCFVSTGAEIPSDPNVVAASSWNMSSGAERGEF